eukprot:TRINITY_DN37261_c0_g1_i2.p1 TRINITY_DN37261_c0_g1~~TRINITY_DN37261_c0_g1_i2.p1  ORF type:complete len:219 (+),score=24.86 TRINITY_DN37261_c0_g1_i2:275-931(+)
MLAGASMNKAGVLTVASEPIRVRRDSLVSTLNHEVGTHFMRRQNDKQQLWGSKKKRQNFGLRTEVTTTEEGLACLNTHLNGNRWLWKAALHYYAACCAAEMSFAQLFEHLEQYLPDPNRRWNEVLRVKRGVVDLARPGCYPKDQCYFKGAVAILRQVDSIDFMLLYSGRISLEDLAYVDTMRDIVIPPMYVPDFLEDVESYRQRLREIAHINGIDLVR